MNSKEDCAFELSYIKKEHDKSGNKLISEVRIEHGKLLAKRHPVKVDYIVPIPETAIFYAQGYALETKIPLVHAIYKNRPKPKTLFVKNRRALIKKVFTVMPNFIRNKKIVLIDETIISGLSLITILEMVKNLNPKELHLRLANPPMIKQCPSNNFGEKWTYNGHLIKNSKYIDSFKHLELETIEKFAKCCYCFGGVNDESKVVRY